ncbi:MAG TPA: hypothetical protein VF222_09760 [Nitrososphaeraceae archaeon]
MTIPIVLLELTQYYDRYRNLWEDPEYQKKYSLSTKNNNDENEDITF